MKLLQIFTLLAAVILTESFPWGSTQSIAVTGTLLCNGKPAQNIRVKLYEDETVLDTRLDEKETDANGEFHVSGSKKELSTIDPKVNIYHKCNYNGKCVKKVSIKIPKNYISEGSKPVREFDIGVLNLAGSFSGQTVDCIN